MFSLGRKFAADGTRGDPGTLAAWWLVLFRTFISASIPGQEFVLPEGNKPSPGVQMCLAVAGGKWPGKCRGSPHVGLLCWITFL